MGSPTNEIRIFESGLQALFGDPPSNFAPGHPDTSRKEAFQNEPEGWGSSPTPPWFVTGLSLRPEPSSEPLVSGARFLADGESDPLSHLHRVS